MRTKKASFFVGRIFNDQVGQVLPTVTLMLFCILGMGGLTVDVGRAYVAKRALQSASDAAALASAEDIYATNDQSDALAKATAVFNATVLNNPILTGAQMQSPTPVCISSLMSNGVTCASMKYAPNAVKICETLSVGTWFIPVVGGPKSLNILACSQASYGTNQPYNVAFILDSTPSLNTKDSSGNCNSFATAELCALNGIQSMLTQIAPCKNGLASCNATSANALMRVAFFTFPNITVADTKKDSCQSGGTPAAQPYSFPSVPTSGSTAPYTFVTYKTTGNTSIQETYLITQPGNDSTNIDANGFSSDYYKAGATNNMNTSSVFAKIITGCMKVPSSGNASSNNNSGSGITYQAAAIYAAQAALQAEQAQTTNLGINAINVIIFVSDGQANAESGYFNPTSDTITAGSGGSVAMTGTGVYPDDHQQCQQTIAAAQYAATQGTRVYGVAYGSETGGCSTDTKVVNYLNTSQSAMPITAVNQIVPCDIMEDTSSINNETKPPSYYFYGDVTSQSNGCLGNSTTGADMNAIFSKITETLTSPRLIPSNAS